MLQNITIISKRKGGEGRRGDGNIIQGSLFRHKIIILSNVATCHAHIHHDHLETTFRHM